MEENQESEKEKENFKYANKCFDHLSKRWDFLDETRILLSNTFDKYLLTFATGSLYLSILFTNNFNNCFPIHHKWLLGVGWGTLLLSIISSLLSIYFSILSYAKQMEYTKENIEAINENKNYCEPINLWNIALAVFQMFAIISFVIGIIVLALFYYLNIQ